MPTTTSPAGTTPGTFTTAPVPSSTTTTGVITTGTTTAQGTTTMSPTTGTTPKICPDKMIDQVNKPLTELFDVVVSPGGTTSTPEDIFEQIRITISPGENTTIKLIPKTGVEPTFFESLTVTTNGVNTVTAVVQDEGGKPVIDEVGPM